MKFHLKIGYGNYSYQQLFGKQELNYIYANGILVARETDPTVSHPFPPSPPCAPHVAVVNKGSLNVFVVGLPVARVTDSADAGAMTSGSPNVYANGV